MSESNDNKLRELLIEAKGKLRIREEREQHENELIEIHQRHGKELKQAKLEAANDAFKRSLASSPAGRVSSPLPHKRKAQQWRRKNHRRRLNQRW